MEEEEGENEEQRPKKGGVTAEIREALLSGASEEELVKEGYNAGSVRVVSFELDKSKLRKRPSKNSKTPPPKDLQVFAKGSPPEAIVESLEVPSDLDGSFRAGMRFGMMSIISGIRIAQELSQIGVQQARPLVEMARDMRQGEANAAKAASTEAAYNVANQLNASIQPALQEIEGRLNSLQQPRVSSGNPMSDMMVRMMEPMVQNVVSKFTPGALPAPSGWTKKRKESG